MLIIEELERSKKKQIISADMDINYLSVAAKNPLSQITADLNEQKKGFQYFLKLLFLIKF